MSKKYIFTDIDGVLNPKFNKVWNKKCVDVYNRICKDFDLQPVITSTWRIKYNKKQMQEIFIRQGIMVNIYDYTPVLMNDRGLEIEKWLQDNEHTNYIVVDDKVTDIESYVTNVIHCKGWIGLIDEHYDEIKKLLR